MFYFMELPDTKQATINTALTYVLNRFPHLRDGLHKLPPENRQVCLNNHAVHSLKWCSEDCWLGWGAPKERNEVEIPFPSEGLVIGVL